MHLAQTSLRPSSACVASPRAARGSPALCGSRNARGKRLAALRAAAAPPPSAVPAPLQFDLPGEAPLRCIPLSPAGAWHEVESGITAPRGFSAQGAHAGLRTASTRADLALLVSSTDAVVAAAMAGGADPSPSISSNRLRLSYSPTARAVVVAAGRDEAGTGGGSIQGCQAVVAAAAQALVLRAEEVLLVEAGSCARLDSPSVLGCIARLGRSLDPGAEGAYHAACALTSAADTVCKSAALEVCLGEDRSTGRLGQPRAVRLGGMANGGPQGMQAVVTCDAPVTEGLWQAMFGRALEASFRQAVLPGCVGPSPADSLLALANGAAGGPVIEDGDSIEARRLEAALTALMQGLAKEVAWDAARCLLDVDAKGAPSNQAARAVARAVAGSPGVIATVRACKPDVTPIVEAISASGVAVDRGALRVAVGGMPLLHRGRAPLGAASYATEYLHSSIGRRGEVRIEIVLSEEGAGTGTAWGSAVRCSEGSGSSSGWAGGDEEEESCGALW